MSIPQLNAAVHTLVEGIGWWFIFALALGLLLVAFKDEPRT